MILRLIVVGMLAVSLAQAAGLSEQFAQFERDASADGALLAMVDFCKHPASESQKLKEKMMQDALGEKALEEAKKSGLKLSEELYLGLAYGGYRSTQELLSSMPRSGKNYKRNCDDVTEKIAKRMKP